MHGSRVSMWSASALPLSPSPGVHISIPGLYFSVTHVARTLCVIMLTVLRWGDYFALSRWVLNSIKSIVKKEGRGGFNMGQKRSERTKQRGCIGGTGDGERGWGKE